MFKRGGGVALMLTNLREAGAPIKGIENQSSGVIPVMKLLEDGERTLNAKLIESAHQVLQRYNVRIADLEALNARTEALRERYRTTAQHSRLGEHTGAVATPGGVSLPAGYKPPSAEGLLGSAS